MLTVCACDLSADDAAANCELHSQDCNRAIRTTDADADIDETAVSVNVGSSPLSLVSHFFLLFLHNLNLCTVCVQSYPSPYDLLNISGVSQNFKVKHYTICCYYN